MPQQPVVAPLSPGAERRTNPDRRRSPTSVWDAFRSAGQRRRNRRADEHRQSYFVDRFSPALFVVILMLLAASILDAVLTIRLLWAGAQEINPLMNGLLGHGLQPFLLVKYVLTAGGLPLLLIYQNHYLFGTRIRVGYLIPIVVAMYAVLIGYQMVLIHAYAAP